MVIDGATNTTIDSFPVDPVGGEVVDPVTTKIYVTANIGLLVINGTTLGSITLLSPTDNALNVALNPMLKWSPATGATAYIVQASTNIAFSSLVIDTSVSSDSLSAVLNGSTKYYWRVAGTLGLLKGPQAVDSFTTTTGIGVLGGKPQYTLGAMGYSGMLVVYSIDGRRVMKVPFDASAIKGTLLRDAQKGLAKGIYTYCIQRDGKMISQARMLVH